MNIIKFAASVIAGFAAGYSVVWLIMRGALKKQSSVILREAKKQAQEIKENAAREEQRKFQRLAEELRRNNENLENSLQKRSQEIQRKLSFIGQKDKELDAKAKSVDMKLAEINQKIKLLKIKEEEVTKKSTQQKDSLEKIARMPQEEAKKILIASMEEEARSASQTLISGIIKQAEEDAQSKARLIIATAMQKAATDEVQALATTVVQIPNDDLKGRIIGKEGRNIKAFEAATGVELIVDDSPGVITLSSFDGVRRYIGKLTLEWLIADGRIHPGRIEELASKAKAEAAEHIMKIGRDVADNLQISGLKDELVEILGRKECRFSYRQNILQHSQEVSKLARFLAAELGGDTELAARAGLLHDVGKAASGEIDGSHAIIGAEIARKNGENEKVVNAIKAHHEEAPFETLEAVLVSVADTLSATRPGARMETVENYLKRITKIEEIAMLFDGVERAYAISAGREVRVIVKPEKVTESNAPVLTMEIARKISREVEYPGQLKVSLIREQRWSELA